MKYKRWLKKKPHIYIELQKKCAKEILPKRQAVIAEETVELDEEHQKDYNGASGIDSARGTI